MNKKDFIFYGIIIILLIAVFYLISLMKSETTQCIRNPFVYGAYKLKNVQCNCMQFNDENKLPATFFFNDTAFLSGKEESKFAVPMQ